MKRLLMVSPQPLFPTNDGGRVRVWQLATHLAKRFEVHVLAPASGGRDAATFAVHELPSRGRRQLFDPRLPLAMRTMMDFVRPDLVMLEHMWQGAHILPWTSWHRVPLVLDTHNVNTVRFRRQGHRLWPLVSLYERAMVRLASRILATSEVDRAGLIGLGAPPERTMVVPNGVDTKACRSGSAAARRDIRERLGVADRERMLFFFGQLSYAPNVGAVGVLADEIMPRLPREYRLFVAGRGPVDELRRRYGSPRLEFLGPVESVLPYLHAADVVPVPITHGSGTRLKILESVACGVPTVSTPVGCEGIDVDACGGTLVVRSEWNGFAEQVQAVASMPHRQPGDAFARKYDWSSVTERIAV